MTEYHFAGFVPRFFAFLIDSFFVMLFTVPIMFAIYGKPYFMASHDANTAVDILVQYLAPACAVVIFWVYRSATPGKMLLGMILVDIRTGNKLTTRQCIVRYLSYYVALLPLGAGFIWIIYDKKKQGWHDKIAGTAVVKRRIC